MEVVDTPWSSSRRRPRTGFDSAGGVHFTRASSVLLPEPVVEYIPPAPAGSLLSVPVVECFAPEPAVSQSPVVEYISLVPAVFHAPANLPARVRAEVRVGGLQGSVPGQSSTARRGDEEAAMPTVTLWLRKRTEGRSRLRVKARRSLPLRSVFQAYCRRLSLQASQVRIFFGELFSPDDSRTARARG